MDECIFCKIVRKEIPAKLAGESEGAAAFYDINPQAPVHVLIIPKEHIASAMDVGPGHGKTLEAMFALAQDCVKKEKLEPTGFRLVMNYGPDAGQSVHHLHMHMLGRRKLAWPPG